MVKFSTSVLVAVEESQRPDPTLNIYVQPPRFDLHGNIWGGVPLIDFQLIDLLYSLFHPLTFTFLT